MTIDELGKLIIDIDPEATRYRHIKKSGERGFTTWQEVRRLNFPADDRNQGGWDCQIDRYTFDEHDQIAEEIERRIEETGEAAISHRVAFDMESGMIRHIFVVQVA